jgi:hypothetical protein
MDIKDLALDIHANAMEKGFWEEDRISEKLMLIVSELSEALEADRHNNHYKGIIKMVLLEEKELFNHIFERTVKDTFEDELADAFIRILDLATHHHIDIMSHVIAKHRYNKTREYKHGKRY